MDGPHLPQALACLAAQTWPSLEILVVDATGGRHRPLPDLALRPGHAVRMVCTGRPLTRPQAANAGIEAATGEFFSLLDDDDTCEPEHVATLVAAAALHPDKLVVYGSAKVLGTHGSSERFVGAGFNRALLYDTPLLFWRAALFRTAVRELGCRVDESLEICEDRDYLAQIAEHSDFGFVPGVTFGYRPDAGTSGTGLAANRGHSRALPFEAKLRARWGGPRAEHMERVTRLCRRAIAAYAEGDGREAERWFARVLLLYPDDPNALHGCGRLLLERGELQGALANVRRAIAVRSEVPEYHYTLARILHALGEAAGAAEAASVAMRDPRFVAAAAQLGGKGPAPSNADRRTADCACGSGRKFKHCCGRLSAWTPAPHAGPTTLIAAALEDDARGEGDAACARLSTIDPDDVADAVAAASAAAVLARSGDIDRAIAYVCRSLALRPDESATRALFSYSARLYRHEMQASVRATVERLLEGARRGARPRSRGPIHVVAALGALGGTENRAAGLRSLLGGAAPITLWSVPPSADAPPTPHDVRIIREDRGEFPRGGTIVFLGTYFDYGDWVHRCEASRIVLCHNIDLPVHLVQKITQVTECSGALVELTFPTAWFRSYTGLPGTVETSWVDTTRFSPGPPRAAGASLVVGRHSRDDTLKHHPNDPSLYRRLVREGHRCRILGGMPLAKAFVGDPAAASIELRPTGSEDARAFLSSLDCFLYRVSPEFLETGGTVVLEAMAMGLPVVVFEATGGPVDWIEPERTGFIVATEDEALAAIARLAADPALRQRVGRAAREQVLALMEHTRAATRAFYLGSANVMVDERLPA